MAYQIKHLKLGGILDQAINIVKNHFGLLFTIMLFLLIPFELLQGFIGLVLQPELPEDATTEEVLAAIEAADNLKPIGVILAIAYGLIIVPVTNAAVIHSVARIYLGQAVTALEAIKYAFTRLIPLIGTSILMGLAILGGFLLLIIPGILFALWFGLAQHVVVIERIAGAKALGRSRKLVRPHLGTFLMLGIILGLIGAALGAGSQFIPQPHLRVIGYVAVNAAYTVLWTAALTVFYFSCRCAEENFDLHYLAESLGEEEAGGGQIDPLRQPTY